MSISVESTKQYLIVNLKELEEEKEFILQRAFYQNKTWNTWTEKGFIDLENLEEEIKPLLIKKGVFIDSFELSDGLYEYRYIDASITEPKGEDYIYSEWCKFGQPSAIGYTFQNYTPPSGSWGTVVTPDDLRYSYLWGTDFKATNGEYFTDEQIQFFIDEAVSYIERQLNITIKKQIIKSQASDRNFVKNKDYDIEEPYYDFSYRKIQRYGMIQTKHRPVIKIEKFELLNRNGNNNINLLDSSVVDKTQGIIKFTKRPFKPSDTVNGLNSALARYGTETMNPHLFYLIDYVAGFENSDEVPNDLRQIIAKVVAISLLNIIGDGLMSGFSSSSLSMDGISESFSSTQSATSAYFGARIAVYQKEVENYIKENRYRFGFIPMGAL